MEVPDDLVRLFNFYSINEGWSGIQVEAFATTQLDSLAPPLLLTSSAEAASPPLPDMGAASGEGSGLGDEAVTEGVSETEAIRLCSLYCALCIKRHRLLLHLLEVYGKAADPARYALCV